MAGRAAGIGVQLGADLHPDVLPDRRRAATQGPDFLDAGEGLRTYVLQRYKHGNITAKDVCSICYFAEKAGATGVSDLALAPENRHHTEHVLKAVGARAKDGHPAKTVPPARCPLPTLESSGMGDV